MAKPSATNNRIEPKLMPVNTTPKRSPQANASLIVASEAMIWALTLGSVSTPSCWLRSNCASGLFACPSVWAACKRSTGSATLMAMAALASINAFFTCSLASTCKALLIKGNLAASGSFAKAMAACKRTLSSGLSSFSAAKAASISPRIRLLLITSSVTLGMGISAAVTAS